MEMWQNENIKQSHKNKMLLQSDSHIRRKIYDLQVFPLPLVFVSL